MTDNEACGAGERHLQEMQGRKTRTCVKADSGYKGFEDAVTVPAKEDCKRDGDRCAVLLMGPVREAASLAEKRAILIVVF